MQIGLAAVLTLVAPLLGAALAAVASPTFRIAHSAGIGKTGMLVLIQLEGGLPYLLVGALAALLTWVLIRKPWDAMGYCALHGALVVTLSLAIRPTGPQVQPWWWPVTIATEVVSLFLGAAVVALLLLRRRPVQVRPTDQSAFLP
ncbi:MAG: hypothetical protein KKI08_07435 [Armatimonadetes bacterium]|nr:hypothetical protein [Armatimonadota bacterium]